MTASTVGMLHRTSQAYCSQLCEKQTLQYGIAYYAQRFAPLPEANQFREVVVQNGALLPVAFAETESWFGDRQLRCDRWVPAVDQPPDPLGAFLSEKGFRPRRLNAMILTEWIDLHPLPDVRILPARAMRAAFRDTFMIGDKQ